ncbi:hypothetical protein PVAP13_5KG191800 [Panicum virgatum]|uniref:Uncharacterized protein n=1 Tax=Panicum virgatum TaxID=38727 RepID=A0A8T0SIR8_PANVG|nr:hypothetical protein PVAP13_5KG191800 [Panicum virgatum]
MRQARRKAADQRRRRLFTTSVNLQTRPTRAHREGAASCLRHSGQPAAAHGGTHYGWFCLATSQPGSRVGGNSATASSLTPAAVREDFPCAQQEASSSSKVDGGHAPTHRH